MKSVGILFALIIAFAGNAFAQQIPDYSLTPEEMKQQPRTNNQTAPINVDQIPGYYNNNPGANFPAAPLLPGENTRTQSKRFMDNYCDRNFRPAIASDPRYANLGNCLQQQKDQVCSQFQPLPNDVKTALDEVISCTNNLLNGENPDQPQSAPAPADCSGADTIRLQLLKKYWRDQNTAYALVFLPDDVLDSSSKCLRGGR